MQRMTDAELTVYLGLIRKATLAEVRDYPAVRQVSEAQRKLADESFEQIFFDEIKRHPRSNQLIAASTNLKLAADADACDLSLLTFKSILRMRGLVAEWQTRVFVESLQ
jgi:hypothetical protein